MDEAEHQEGLVGEFGRRFPIFAPATIARLVSRAYHEFADATVQDFLPVLVRRRVHAQLLELEALPPAQAGPTQQSQESTSRSAVAS